MPPMVAMVGEGVFEKGEPEVAAVVCAKGDIVEGGAEEPG